MFLLLWAYMYVLWVAYSCSLLLCQQSKAPDRDYFARRVTVCVSVCLSQFAFARITCVLQNTGSLQNVKIIAFVEEELCHET